MMHAHLVQASAAPGAGAGQRRRRRARRARRARARARQAAGARTDVALRSGRPHRRCRRRHERDRPRAGARPRRCRRRRRQRRPPRGARRRGRRRDRGSGAGARCGSPADVERPGRARARARRASLERSDESTSCVCAAGITKRVPTLEMADEDWQRIMDTNVTGTLRSCQVFGAGDGGPALAGGSSRSRRCRRSSGCSRWRPTSPASRRWRG